MPCAFFDFGIGEIGDALPKEEAQKRVKVPHRGRLLPPWSLGLGRGENSPSLFLPEGLAVGGLLV